jgi:Phage tail sheath protein subtilisin-like domain/Phage tail sheath C-terminal domain
MSLNLVSPGIKIREVDLTVGRIDAVNDQVGAIAGPFAKGPINVPVLVETEQDLLNTFGKPSDKDAQYEYWLAASSYLSYGGTLRVIRSNDTDLINAHAPVSSPVSLKILSEEDYNNNYSASSDWLFSAREAGTWANGLKVCVIDGAADQRIAIGTFGVSVGYAITCGVTTSYVTSTGSVQTFVGFVKGIITKVNEGSIDVKIVSRTDTTTGIATAAKYEDSSLNKIIQNGYYQIFNNVGTASSIEKVRIKNGATVGLGSTTISIPQDFPTSDILAGDLIQSLNSTFKARVVGVTTSRIIVDQASPVSLASTTLVVTYTRNIAENTLQNGEGLLSTNERNPIVDWYDQQTLGLSNSTVYWKSIAPKPKTSQYALERNGTNDEMHVVVVDDSGAITGISGNILEKFTNLSKASDGKVSPSENIYYKSYVQNSSSYIYAGTQDSIVATNFTTLTSLTPKSGGSIAWGQNATAVDFGCVGNKTYTLANGFDYGANGGMDATLGEVLNSYEILSNPAEYKVNFIISGPSGGATIFDSQAKANRLISIAEARKDCVVTISPYRSGVVNVTNSDTQTSNIINFFDSVTSSSYAVFDSGYKYMFDRFNNTFRYIPLNGDIAGLMARTSINNYPWFSPAGSSRGTINNAIKLAFNPSQAQRDLLYPKRINPVIFSPGAGIILFGDKTGLSYSSAFDRINVRRLFLTIEETISRAARAQLFEFNDTITRTNFLNIVEPYLRDVKAKRGITDFLVVCDESNNTPDVIDANQFRADIFIKPARSINFIGLTFVANRTGVSFEEVVGTV